MSSQRNPRQRPDLAAIASLHILKATERLCCKENLKITLNGNMLKGYKCHTHIVIMTSHCPIAFVRITNIWSWQ